VPPVPRRRRPDPGPLLTRLLKLQPQRQRPRLELHPYVPRRDSLALQRDSDALLLLIPDAGGRGQGVLSGKVFEYLAAERPILAAVPPDGAAAELIREETGRRPDEFAYPYGDVNPAVATAVAKVYTRACTTELRVLRSGDRPELLPRLDMFYWREPGRLEAWGSPQFQGRLWMRAQARRLRERLAAGSSRW